MRLNKYIIFLYCVCSVAASYALRDPTEPPIQKIEMKKIDTKEQPATSVFTVNNILISKKRRIVVINGKMLGVNDVIDNAKVIKIERDRVFLKQGSKVTELLLLPNDLVVTKRK